MRCREASEYISTHRACTPLLQNKNEERACFASAHSMCIYHHGNCGRVCPWRVPRCRTWWRPVSRWHDCCDKSGDVRGHHGGQWGASAVQSAAHIMQSYASNPFRLQYWCAWQNSVQPIEEYSWRKNCMRKWRKCRACNRHYPDQAIRLQV